LDSLPLFSILLHLASLAKLHGWLAYRNKIATASAQIVSQKRRRLYGGTLMLVKVLILSGEHLRLSAHTLDFEGTFVGALMAK
jgi:hypothetical protein